MSILWVWIRLLCGCEYVVGVDKFVVGVNMFVAWMRYYIVGILRMFVVWMT